MNTLLPASWASFSRSFSRSNCIGHYLTRMPSVASSFKCDVSRGMNYMVQATWLRTKGNAAAIVTATVAMVVIHLGWRGACPFLTSNPVGKHPARIYDIPAKSDCRAIAAGYFNQREDR